MITPAAEQTLVPSTACFHIGNGNQRLRAHPGSVSPNKRLNVFTVCRLERPLWCYR
jgi:hypothetical protein